MKLNLLFLAGVLLLAGCGSESIHSADPASVPSPPVASAEPIPTEIPNQLPTVISTGDGDTLRVNIDGESVTIRMACIDAPETAQDPWGKMASDRLAELLPRGQAVQVREIERDRYGRTVAELFLGNEPVNLRLVKDGMAVVYTEYLDSCADTRDLYLQAEAEAKAAKRGFWNQENPVMPWDFRKGNTTNPQNTPTQPVASPKAEQPTHSFPACVQSDCDCGDFATQAEAQKVLDSFAGDPHELDGNQDGMACESLP